MDMKLSKVIYSLNIEDVQNVAEQEFDIKLSQKELKIVEDKIGDYIDWYEAISFAIKDAIKNKKK